MENIHQSEADTGLKRSEIIQHSLLAGNFSENLNNPDPSKDIFMIELDGIKEYVQFLPFLPHGFGFTGGTARGALLSLLGNQPPQIRDYDVEAINDLNPDYTQIDTLYPILEKGQSSRIGTNEDLVSYFATRDFTINEVFLYGNHLYFSRQAIEDMQNKTIRFTEFESNDNQLTPRMAIRALLLEIEFIKLYGFGAQADKEKWKWKNIPHFGSFDLAVGLNKAIEKNIEVQFLHKLFQLTIFNEDNIPEGPSDNGVRRLALLLRHLIAKQGHGEFTFSNDYFNQDYNPDWEKDDEAKFEQWYQTSLKNTLTMRHVTPSDLE